MNYLVRPCVGDCCSREPAGAGRLREVANTPELQIEQASPADFDSLYGLYQQVVADGGALPKAKDGIASKEAFEIGWMRDRHVYVARDRDAVVGTYFIRANFPAFAAHIAQGGYIVVPSARRRGIGRHLLEHSLEEAARLGFTAMMFNLVFEDNPSRRLYESVGFQAVGRIPHARGEEAAIIYWRAL